MLGNYFEGVYRPLVYDLPPPWIASRCTENSIEQYHYRSIHLTQHHPQGGTPCLVFCNTTEPPRDDGHMYNCILLTLIWSLRDIDRNRIPASHHKSTHHIFSCKAPSPKTPPLRCLSGQSQFRIDTLQSIKYSLCVVQYTGLRVVTFLETIEFLGSK